MVPKIRFRLTKYSKDTKLGSEWPYWFFTGDFISDTVR